MKAIDVAGMFIQRHGDSIHLTNLSLNKLVYFAQVESIRRTGKPLFDDEVQAWNYGPVEPDVYRAFKVYGSGEITASVDMESDSFEEDVVDAVAREYGWMTAFASSIILIVMVGPGNPCMTGHGTKPLRWRTSKVRRTSWNIRSRKARLRKAWIRFARTSKTPFAFWVMHEKRRVPCTCFQRRACRGAFRSCVRRSA
ncbi:MAG: Panacea domain-containing protein [Parascardovia denticolens]